MQMKLHTPKIQIFPQSEHYSEVGGSDGCQFPMPDSFLDGGSSKLKRRCHIKSKVSFISFQATHDLV